MSEGKKIKKYIWLVNTLMRFDRLTLRELQELWVDEEVDEGNPLARTTLFNYRDAIMDMMNVVIECDNYHRYFITNPSVLDSDQVQRWLLSSMTMHTVLEDAASLGDRVLLENTPLGVEYLPLVIKAMRANRQLVLTYQKFNGDWSERTVSPYVL